MENLFSIILWIGVGLVYLSGLIWSFRDYWDQDNLLDKVEKNNYNDEHISI